jgi:hypothetical protein
MIERFGSAAEASRGLNTTAAADSIRANDKRMATSLPLNLEFGFLPLASAFSNP